MKKNKLLAILSLALTFSCLFSALSMNAFCINQLDNVFYVTNREHTSITNTYGYSSVSYTGNYYGGINPNNNAILAGEVYGGPMPDYITELEIDMDGEDFVYLDSDTEESRTLSASVVSTSIQIGYLAESFQCSCAISGDGDIWTRNYSAEWGGFPYGWDNYEEESFG